MSNIDYYTTTYITFIYCLVSDIYLAITIVIIKMRFTFIIGVLTTCMTAKKTIKKHLNFFSRAWSSRTLLYYFNRKHNA